MFAQDEHGRRWLVKDYGGNQDRVATELVANAVYREVGAVAPPAGTVDRPGGRKAVAYPTVEGEIRPHTFSQRGPSTRVGAHFMTDALLANHDVAGLEDDNILWQPHPTRAGVERPVRLDQGGTLEYRAMGAAKEFGPVPSEVETMMAKPSRQGARSSKVTRSGLREQAGEIATKLTPARVDEIVDAAPWGDPAMKERVRANLKARVAWMRRFWKGEVTVNLPGLQEVRVEADTPFWLLAEAAIPAAWNEALHPRDQFGKWIDKAAGLSVGKTLQLDSKTTLKKDKDGSFRVTRSGAITKGFVNPADAVRAAADKSAKSKDADSLGGATSHKDFNAYLTHRLGNLGWASTSVEKGTLPSGTMIAFGGASLDKAKAEQELGNIRARLAVAKHSGMTDKYVARAVPYIEAREKELAAKVKAAGWDTKIGSSFAKLTAPGSGTPNVDAVLGALPPTAKAYLAKGDATHGGLKLHQQVVADVAGEKVPGTITGLQPGSGNVQVKSGTGGLFVVHHSFVKPADVAPKMPSYIVQGEHLSWPSGPGSPSVKVTGATGGLSGKVEVKVTATDATHVAAGIGTYHFVDPEELKPFSGGSVPDTGTHQQAKNVVEDFPEGTQVKLTFGQKPVTIIGPTADGNVHVSTQGGKIIAMEPHLFVGAMKVGDPAPKPGPKVSGKQENTLGVDGAPAPLKKLDLAVGDKVQWKKGGWIYEVTNPAAGVSGLSVQVKGPDGSTKLWAGYKAPHLVQKADKSKLKLKAEGGVSAQAAGNGMGGETANPYNVSVGDVLKHSSGGEYTVIGTGLGTSKAVTKLKEPGGQALHSTPEALSYYTHTGKTAGPPPGTLAQWEHLQPGAVLHHKGSGFDYKVETAGQAQVTLTNTEVGQGGSPFAVHKGTFEGAQNEGQWTIKSAAPVAPQKTHAEHVADVKAHLATSLGGTLLQSTDEAVFQTPSGKVLYKSPVTGSITDIESGATVNVAGSVEPPKLSSAPSALESAKKALALKTGVTPGKAPEKPPEPDASWASLPTGNKAHQKLQDGQNSGKFSSAARTAIKDYTGSGYQYMNPQLRNKPGHKATSQVEDQIIAFDSVFAEVPGLSEDMVLWRGVNGNTGDDYKTKKVGDVIRDNGYISTSVDEGFADSWGVVMVKMRLPKGTKAVYVSSEGGNLSSQGGGTQSEQELILRHGVGFKVIARRVRPGGKVELVVEPTVGHL